MRDFIPDCDHTLITVNYRELPMFLHYCVSVNLVANFLLGGYHNQAGTQLGYSEQSDVQTAVVVYLSFS